jgi:thioredoxin-related protein
MPDVARWQSHQDNRALIEVVSTGSQADNQRMADSFSLRRVLIQEDREVADRYQASGTPSAVLVGVDGLIASGVVGGAEAVRSVVSRIRSEPSRTLPLIGIGNGHQHAGHDGRAHPVDSSEAARPFGLPIGVPAPEIRLPNLDAQNVDLSDYRGNQTLLLFWRPSCGFCQQMVADLKAWEGAASSTGPRLLLISSGSVDENRAMGLHSEVLLESALGLGRRFGIGGTPCGVLIDSEGRVASRPANGAPAIWELLALPGVHVTGESRGPI